jgi:hypothetical protein
VAFWCKTHNSSVGNISRSRRFMMVPNHDLIRNTKIMRRRRAVEKSNCFACQNIAMRKHVEMIALDYADSRGWVLRVASRHLTEPAENPFRVTPAL